MGARGRAGGTGERACKFKGDRAFATTSFDCVVHRPTAQSYQTMPSQTASRRPRRGLGRARGRSSRGTRACRRSPHSRGSAGRAARPRRAPGRGASTRRRTRVERWPAPRGGRRGRPEADPVPRAHRRLVADVVKRPGRGRPGLADRPKWVRALLYAPLAKPRLRPENSATIPFTHSQTKTRRGFIKPAILSRDSCTARTLFRCARGSNGAGGSDAGGA